MAATVSILDTNTGISHIFTDQYYDGRASDWDDGNYSCDCNRGIACGHDQECGYGRYRVLGIFYDGKFDYCEDENHEKYDPHFSDCFD